MPKVQKDNIQKNAFSAWLHQQAINVVIMLLVLMLFILVLWPRIVITIGPGEKGVLYKRFSGGTVLDRTYPEGIKLIFPWDKLFIYDLRVQAITRNFTVLTTKGLPITLDLVIRYRPQHETLAMLHQQVGEKYLDKIVIPEVEAVLRKIIGSLDFDDMYRGDKQVLDDVILKALEEAGQKYVHIDKVLIRKLQLPDPIREAIENKLIFEQQFQAYEFRLKRELKEAERKRIEAKGIRDYQKTVTETLKPSTLRWQGIQATKALAKSNNAKIVIIGSGKDGLPIILGGLNDPPQLPPVLSESKGKNKNNASQQQ